MFRANFRYVPTCGFNFQQVVGSSISIWLGFNKVVGGGGKPWKLRMHHKVTILFIVLILQLEETSISCWVSWNDLELMECIEGWRALMVITYWCKEWRVSTSIQILLSICLSYTIFKVIFNRHRRCCCLGAEFRVHQLVLLVVRWFTVEDAHVGGGDPAQSLQSQSITRNFYISQPFLCINTKWNDVCTHKSVVASDVFLLQTFNAVGSWIASIPLAWLQIIHSL